MELLFDGSPSAGTLFDGSEDRIPTRFVLPKRKRKSRFIEIDGHNVLRDNNYTLENGISTFSGHAAQERRRSLPKIAGARSAYFLFSNQIRPALIQSLRERGSSGIGLMSSVAREIADLWRAQNTQTTARYRAMARVDKARFAKESREREELLVAMAAEESAAAAAAARAVEALRMSKLRAAEEKKQVRARKRDAAALSRSKRPRKQSRKQVVTVHNQSVREDLAARKRRRQLSLAPHIEALRPFVSDALLDKVFRDDGQEPATPLPLVALSQQPDYIVGGTLRGYQIEGVNWLIQAHDRGINGILADEMGLGKTVQTITFLSYLKYNRKATGPSLIVVPLSVLTAWCEEFKRWSPEMRLLRLHSSCKEERERVKRQFMESPLSVDIVITTYEMMVSPNMRHLLSSRLHWRYVVMDEGHKIKNEETNISVQMAKVHSEGRLILTGTPLQNNLHELWALLSYLEVDLFGDDSGRFDQAFDLTKNLCDADQLAKAHYLLRLFQLRRLKREVEFSLPPKLEVQLEVDFVDMQRFWAEKLLSRDARMLAQCQRQLQGTGLDHTSEEEDGAQTWKRLNNLLMQLRKVCNHPYMLPGAESEFDGTTTEDLVQSSGKMVMLDRLLKKLKAQGSRAVLFTQFIGMLDILEDYCRFRGWRYARLDGSTSRVRRSLDLRVFNAPNSKVFLYLMSTRAGGLGINAQTADTCILYDSDWNPQIDLQAMARVHRIGQTKKVHVYRLVTKRSVEERILARARKKLYLDKMVNRDSTRQAMEFEKLGKKEMLKMLSFGAHAILKGDDKGGAGTMSDAQLDKVMDRTVDFGAPEKNGSSVKCGTAPSATEQQDTAETFVAEQPALDFRRMMLPEKKRKQSLQDIGSEWQKVCSAKRKREGRIVQVGGQSVLKVNNYSVEGGRYVFGKAMAGVFKVNARVSALWLGEDGGGRSEDAETFAGVVTGCNPDGSYKILFDDGYRCRAQPATSMKASTKTGRRMEMAGRDYEHESHCLICWDGGSLLCCDLCPTSFHEKCLHGHGLMARVNARIGVSAVVEKFKCPHHSCSRCGRGNSAAGGLLLRCTECPTTFCEDCEPRGQTVLDSGECERFQRLGQKHPRTAFFIQCSPQCSLFYRTRRARGSDAAVLEQQQQDRKMKRKSKSSSAPVAAAEHVAIPPDSKTCRRKSGSLVSDQDGWDWYIAGKSDTPRDIAHRYHLDATRVVYENQCIPGLTLSARLISGTPLLLGRTKDVSAKLCRSSTPVSVVGVAGLS